MMRMKRPLKRRGRLQPALGPEGGPHDYQPKCLQISSLRAPRAGQQARSHRRFRAPVAARADAAYDSQPMPRRVTTVPTVSTFTSDASMVSSSAIFDVIFAVRRPSSSAFPARLAPSTTFSAISAPASRARSVLPVSLAVSPLVPIGSTAAGGLLDPAIPECEHRDHSDDHHQQHQSEDESQHESLLDVERSTLCTDGDTRGTVPRARRLPRGCQRRERSSAGATDPLEHGRSRELQRAHDPAGWNADCLVTVRPCRSPYSVVRGTATLLGQRMALPSARLLRAAPLQREAVFFPPRRRATRALPLNSCAALCYCDSTVAQRAAIKQRLPATTALLNPTRSQPKTVAAGRCIL